MNSRIEGEGIGAQEDGIGGTGSQDGSGGSSTEAGTRRKEEMIGAGGAMNDVRASKETSVAG